jgi:2-oxoglutarate dehydrogenase E2 component (dihydrolipoamide succinyltransferase)
MPDIIVPEMGESIVDARVARWMKQPGDVVAAGEPLVELETDKVDVEVAAPSDGVLEAVLHPAGADVKIGEVLGRLAAGGAKPAAAPAPAPVAAPAAAALAAVPAATPSARKTAREQQVPLASVKTDGPRITKADVEKAVPRDRVPPAGAESRTPAPPKAAAPRREVGARSEERVRMSRRRATIARRLVEAQQTAAMLTTFNEVDMSAVMSLRERQKEAFKARHGVGLGIASFFVKATVVALGEFPRLNAEIQGDEMVLKHYYDIGVAVGAAEGLVVPVLRDADRMSFAEIELGIREFAGKASGGTLTLEDLKGGSFSITNGGVFGSLLSTPILNPPQVGILGLHAIKERPVGVGGQVVLRPMMYIALTYDHRIVDGAEAVRFLVRVKALIEDPATLVIG